MSFTLDPDRLFPADPKTRDIARGLYQSIADLPIISPHGHVAPSLLLENEHFSDPTNLFVTFDHYVFRMLNANGVDLEKLGVGTANPVEPRAAWKLLCENWHVLEGTASGYWLTHEFVTLFGIDEEPSAETADAIYDKIAARLSTDDFKPRSLFKSFDIEVMATTDDPLDSLDQHAQLADLHQRGELHGKVLPTWRPDKYLDPTHAEFATSVEKLTATVGKSPDDVQGYLEALQASRAKFIEHGAVSADHGVVTPYTVDLSDAELGKLLSQAVKGELDAAGAREFTGAMLLRCAEFSAQDGLVMTVHPGVFRNHSSETFKKFGPDTGHDIPLATEYTRNLHPLLEKVGMDKNLHLVLFGIDETAYSRELAPLAGFYPSVFVGAPWWFIDAPDAIARYRSAITETAGFTRGSGFIDDTRAFLSIPARHDMARRVDSAFLARYVVEGRLPLSSAERIARELTVDQPKRVFKLD